MLTRQDVETALDYMDAHNLVRLSRSYNSASRWRQLHCPFHNNGQEKKPSCGCSLEEEVRDGKVYPIGFFHCFSCNATYPFSKAIKEILSLKGSSLAAHPDLERYVNQDSYQMHSDSLIPPETMTSIYNSYAIDNLKLKLNSKQTFVSEEELATYRFTVPYMYQRKLTDAVIARYDIGFDGKFIPPGRSKYMPCVTFPVHDLQGRTLFICRRSIEGKFFHIPEGVEKSIFGLYEIPQGTQEIIICESVFNALTAVVYGHVAVALLGTGTSHEIEQLKKIGVKSYVLCLDNDEAGHKGTEKLKKALKGSGIVWEMKIPYDDGRDLNDLSYEEFIECYNSRE